LDKLREADWNPNTMSAGLLSKLLESVTRFGVVENLVVRTKGEGYEVLNGNLRLKVYRELGLTSAPCVVLELGDAQARLLAQALNRIRGEDDLGLRAELIKEILETIPQEEVLSLLPETASSLQSLASLGKESIAEHLRAWEEAQKARLHHLAFQFTELQLEVVEEAIAHTLPHAATEGGPNKRGLALYYICRSYLEAQQPV